MSKDQQERSVREELEALAPGLARYKAQETTPEPPAGYFEQLPETVWRRIEREETGEMAGSAATAGERRHRKLKPGLRRFAYATAAAVALVLISLAVFTGRQVPAAMEELALSEADINAYIEYHLDEFDLKLLAEEALGENEGEALIQEEDSLGDGTMDNYLDEIIDELKLEDLL